MICCILHHDMCSPSLEIFRQGLDIRDTQVHPAWMRGVDWMTSEDPSNSKLCVGQLKLKIMNQVNIII